MSQDDQLLVIKNRRLAGTEHWLIIPKVHIRDIESLTQSDGSLRKSLQAYDYHKHEANSMQSF